MTNPLRFTASRLAACCLIACLSAAGAAALAQTAPETFDSSAQTSASQVGPMDRGDEVSVTIEGIGTLTNPVSDRD